MQSSSSSPVIITENTGFFAGLNAKLFAHVLQFTLSVVVLLSMKSLHIVVIWAIYWAYLVDIFKKANPEDAWRQIAFRVAAIWGGGSVLGLYIREIFRTASHRHDVGETAFYRLFGEQQTYRDAWTSLLQHGVREPEIAWLAMIVIFSLFGVFSRYALSDYFSKTGTLDPKKLFGSSDVEPHDEDGVPQSTVIDQVMHPFDNPLNEGDASAYPSDTVQDESIQTVAAAARGCYEQYELGEDEVEIIYFEQTPEYADSFMQVTTEQGEVAEVYIAFTFPPSDCDDWLSYIVSIANPDSESPELLSLEEVTVDGESSALEHTELNWLAEHFAAVCSLPLAADDEKPPQLAPKSMY